MGAGMKLLQQEEARVVKVDGRELGPYKASFAGDTIIIVDPTADIEAGDAVLRRLPNGRDERSIVTEATFFRRGIAGFGPHYQLKFRQGGEGALQRPGHHINITGAQSVQIGDYNTQNIASSLEALVKIIDSSPASADEKEEAKSLLAKFLRHPLVVAGVGAGIGAAVGAVLKP